MKTFKKILFISLIVAEIAGLIMICNHLTSNPDTGTLEALFWAVVMIIDCAMLVFTIFLPAILPLAEATVRDRYN